MAKKKSAKKPEKRKQHKRTNDSQLTREEALSLVNGVISSYQKLDGECNKLNAVTGFSTDSNLGEAIWRMFDMLVARTSESLHDDHSSLSWYIFENQCGEGCLKHSRVGEFSDLYQVTNAEDLCFVMGY